MPNATAEQKTVFFADLDGTLIHSHRHSCDGEARWVEYLNGKKQAFIPERASRKLKESDVEIVPVTSRNPEQLSRLTEFLTSINVRRALINNGSLLISLSGKTDDSEKRFNLETIEDCAAYAEGMEKSFHILQTACGIRNFYAALPCFLSGATDDPKKTADTLRREFAGAGLRIYSENHRVYISPEIITKGAQVKRFCAAFGINRMVCAGDSENDVSMLEDADICFCPKTLADRFYPRGERIICSGFFTEDIADGLRGL